MDGAQLTDVARHALTLMGPLIAGGALARIGEGTLDESTRLLGQAWTAIQRRLAGNKKAEAALTLYEDEPNDSALQQRIVQQIVACFKDDTAASAELAELVRQLQELLPAPAPPTGRSVNVSGHARIGVLNQGDIHGNQTIGRLDMGDQLAPASAPVRLASSQSTQPPPAALAQTAALPGILSADGVHFSYGHALLIGVGTYRNWRLNASATALDAVNLATLLQEDNVAAYPSAQVHLVRDEQATRAGILAALDAFATQVAAAPQPTVIVFFAGHGITSNGTYFLLPHDYDPRNRAGTAIDAATFRQKIDAIAQHAQKVLILLNCCHAGGVGDGVLSPESEEIAPTPPPLGFYAPLAEGSGRVIISSARPAERSGYHGGATVFGAQLLAALRGSAPGQGPAVGVLELFTYLSQHIPSAARSITDPFTRQPLEQHPLLYARRVDQDFPITLRPTAQRGGILNASLSEAIEQFAQVEIQLAQYISERDAPATLVAERDQLLAQVEQ